ncbi:MAG: hypothetical protein WC805_03260 [Patescibacteria group bacterium]|jgi:hypothetical protein
MDEIIIKAREYTVSEFEKYGSPVLLLDLATQVATRLATALEADVDITKMGAYLMDLKLGEAKRDGKRSEHARLSAESGAVFLEQFGLADDVKNKIINCIEAHHGDVPYKSIEAEICANADCYKFLSPRGFLIAFALTGKPNAGFDEHLDSIEKKLDEKHSILSLDICKEELELHYRAFKELIAQSRQKE